MQLLRHMRFWVTAAILTGLSAFGQEEAAPPDTAGQTMAVREAVTEVILALRLQAGEDDGGFFVPPTRTRTVVDHKMVERRYRQVEYERPIYKYEYENYTTIANQTSGSSVAGTSKLGTVTKRRVKSRKQVGTEKRTRLVHDNKGPITRQVKVAIYGSGGPDYLFPGFYAQNAMAMLLFIRAGVEAQDENFGKAIQSMADYVDAYGLPDRTFDLAWLTAAYVNLPQDTELIRDVTKAMVNKLLLGQIREGRGKGLWGPLCTNAELLAKLIEVEQELLAEHVGKVQVKLARGGDKEKLQPLLDKGRQVVNRFHQQLTDVCRHGLQFEKLRGELKARASEDAMIRTGYVLTEYARVPGLPVFFYGEITGDIASTSMVLFALREAQANGLLPDGPDVPSNLNGKPVMRMASTAQVLGDAAEALARLQNRNGTWDEGNSWQAVNAFDKIGIPGLPVEPKDYINSSDLTLLSTVLGHVALADAAAMLGDAGRQYWMGLRASEKTVAQMALALIEGETRGLEIGQGKVGPYAFMFAMARLLEHARGGGAESRSLWFKLASFLMSKRDAATGTWQSGAELVLPTSWDKMLQQHAQTAAAKKDPKGAASPNSRWYNRYYGDSKKVWGVRHDATVPASAYATLLLLQGVRPPLIGAWNWDGKDARTSTIAPVVDRLMKEHGVRLSYAELPAELPANQLAGVPVLFVSGTGRFMPANPACGAPLMQYLSQNGMLVAEAPANSEGEEFLSSLKAALLKLVPQSQAVSLPAGDLLPVVEGVLGPNGRMVAAFLPIRVGREGDGMSSGQAKQFVHTLLSNSIDPELLNKDYAINWTIIEQAEKEIAEKRAAELEAAFQK